MTKRFNNVFTRVLIGVSIAFVSLVGQAQAIPSIVFDQQIDGGTLSFAGGPLTGTDLRFDVVGGIDSPANPGVQLFCDGSCLLNFVTGDVVSEAGGLYTFAAGGSYALTGDLYTGMGGTGTLIASGTLIEGTWGTGAMVQIFFSPITGEPFSLLAFGSGPDLKNTDLADFYGFTDPNFNFLTTMIASDITGYTPGEEGSFSSAVVEADLVNFPAAAVIPEPGSVVLLGAGMIALGAYGRRRLRGPRA